MRLITLYPHGVTMGTLSGKPNKQSYKRGQVNGWSKSATRRNIAFLRSADKNLIQVTPDGELLSGIALTLTLRNCPESSDDWHKIRRSFIKRLERLGMHRCHWVTEWQRRGVPHLHGAFWFPSDNKQYTAHNLAIYCISHWLQVAGQYGASVLGQHHSEIYDSIGWFKYLAKHASRGIGHYQRSILNIPDGWKKTGRIWGYTGDWPLIDPTKTVISEREYFLLRRMARNWRKSDARQSGNPYRIKSARRMLKHNHPEQSKLRGISEWINQETVQTLLDLARTIDGEIDLLAAKQTSLKKGSNFMARKPTDT